jgi:hypothetical protein
MFLRKPELNSDKKRNVYYPAQIHAYYGTEDSFYILINNDGKVIELPKEHLSYFSVLYGAKTLQEHWEDGIREFGQDAGGFLQSLIIKFVDLGLLRAIANLWKNEDERKDGQKKFQKKQLDKVTAFGILTHERPECLKRSAKSYISHIKRQGHVLSYYVFDDSKTEESLSRNKNVIDIVKKELNVEIHLIDKEIKEKFFRILAQKTKKKEVSEDILRFCLPYEGYPIPSTSGANRNLLMLYTVDEISVSVDDDTLYEPIVTGGETEPIITSQRIPNTMDYYHDLENIELKYDIEEFDLIEGYNLLFQNPIKNLIKDAYESDSRVNLKWLSSAFACRLEKDGAFITLGMTGHYGDSGINAPFGMLFLEGESREMVYSNKEYYETAKINRTIHRYVKEKTIYDSPYFFGDCIATDHRNILPPFSPLGRNDDIFFATVVRTCFPNNYLAILPIAVKHLPPGKRYHTAVRFQDTHLDTLHILRFLIEHYGKSIIASSPIQRMYSLGHRLIECGKLTCGEFEIQLKFLMMAQINLINESIYALLRKYDYKPDYWVDDIENYLENLHEAVMDGSIILPRDMRHLGSKKEILTALQTHIYKYGQLLIHWPAIVEAAREIKAERGDRPM